MKASSNLETIAFRSKLESKMGKESFGIPICDSNNEDETIVVITCESQTEMIKESSPTGICGSNTQSKVVGLIKSGSHGKKIKESCPTGICGSSTQFKTIGLIKSGSHGKKIKESMGKASCDENTEADICMELLLDFKVDCDHLEDIPSAEFSRTKTKKQMKQDKQ
ncbi:hypothetical protein DEO72_LG8g2267 [Vigna unguiculata]|uniref:Uncharacterized protein n=1 Tax=Vigna unguiculata TaxID=3917 RepID=A0A4D6MS78_VIGUN|nr:hypothetical protein DEO72_LG8g2267 [Vigna unguiculata]